MLKTPAEKDSLAPVRQVIPKSCYYRSTKRSLGYAIRDLLSYLVILTALIMVHNWWIDTVLIVVCGLIVSALFILGHDASHGAFSEHNWINSTISRILMLPSLHVQAAWDLGHNRIHHGFTARRDMDFVWRPYSVEEYLALSKLGRFRHRLEWSWAGSGIYYLREVWWNKMITFTPTQRWAKAIKKDKWLVFTWAIFASTAAISLGWFQSHNWLSATWMWIKLVGGPFLIFTQIIGWAVYVHHVGPEISWWNRQEWNRWHAQMESTTILRLPKVLNIFFHNIFIHVPHHVEMRIPWYQLPQAAIAIEKAFPGTVVDKAFKIKDYLLSTSSCKLYDYEKRCWSSYQVATKL